MILRFVFANPKQWWKQGGASLLRWADQFPASHFAVELVTIKHHYVFESVFPRTRRLEKHEWNELWTEHSAYEFEVPQHLQWEVLAWLNHSVGKWYSLSQLLLIALCLIKPLNDKLNWSILNHDRFLICTELGSRFIERFMKIVMIESHDKIGLQDLGDLCEQVSFKDQERLWK